MFWPFTSYPQVASVPISTWKALLRLGSFSGGPMVSLRKVLWEDQASGENGLLYKGFRERHEN